MAEKSMKKRIVLVPVMIAASVLVCVLVFAAVRILTGAMNPITRTAVALAGLRDISGGTVTITVTGERRVKAQLDFQLGTDLNDSVFDGHLSGLRIALEGGRFAADIGGVRVFLEGIYEMLEERVSEYAGNDLELNRLVKDGVINYGYIDELYGDEDVKKLLTGFALRECGRKKVLDSFLSDYASEDGVTEYTVDAGAFKAAFVSYLEGKRDSGNEAMSATARRLLDSEYLAKDISGRIDVGYTVTEGKPVRWEMNFDDWSLTAEIDNYNAPDIDREEISAFMEWSELKASRLANMLAERTFKNQEKDYDLKELFGSFFR